MGGAGTPPAHGHRRIVVCSGFGHALRLLFHGRVVRGPLAVESYRLAFHRELLAAASVRTVPLPLDEDGARVDGLDRERAVLLTPAHQFPTGGPLGSGRRAAVVDWAREGAFPVDRESGAVGTWEVRRYVTAVAAVAAGTP